MQTVIERNVEKVISAQDAKALERMTSFRLSDLIREGRAAGIEKADGSWTDGDKMCHLATAVTAAKAHGINL